MTEKLDKNKSYVLGKFKLTLNDDGELKVIIETNKDHLQIKPSSGNSVILLACH